MRPPGPTNRTSFRTAICRSSSRVSMSSWADGMGPRMYQHPEESTHMETNPQELLSLHETMVLIRRAEERLARLFADGEVPGFLHLSIGQEAVPAGICAAPPPADPGAS